MPSARTTGRCCARCWNVPAKFYTTISRYGCKAAVKDMATGEQLTQSVGEAVARIRAGLAQRAQGAPIRDPHN